MTTYSYQPLLPYADYLQAYFSQLGGDIAVLGRVAAQFAVSETSPPGMAVLVAAGAAFRSGSVVEVPARTTSTIAAPVGNPRIDRIVINMTTDALIVVQGVEASTPTAPPVPAGHLPLARIALTPGMTAIANTAITDERLNGGTIAQAGALLNVQTFTSNSTYTPTPGTSKIIVEVVGGGGGAGGTAATNGSTGAASAGGGAGAYARAVFTQNFDNIAVTVGLGGASTSPGANIGNSGGNSSFGTLVASPGGFGGNPGPAFSGPVIIGATNVTALPAGGNIVAAAGGQGAQALVLSPGMVVGGTGASSYFGGGGFGGGNAVGSSAISPGAGGGGSSSILNTGARSGGAGANGIVSIYEYA